MQLVIQPAFAWRDGVHGNFLKWHEFEFKFEFEFKILHTAGRCCGCSW